MVPNIEINQFEDPSVINLLNKTAEDLRKKYTKQRKINEKLLNKKTPAKRVFSVFFDVLCVLILIIGFFVCFSILNTTIQGTLPSFAGYTNLVISSKSMVASGFGVGDIVIVRSVDASTLNVGDKIAFYVYPRSYANFDENVVTNVSDVVSEREYSFSFKQLLGFQNNEIKTAIKNKSDMVFHHIRDIYEDENGVRWFKTYGSSNSADDNWWVNENYIVGVQSEGAVAKVVIGIISFSSTSYGMIILIVPIAALLVVLLLSFLKNIQIAKLELDCVEEKRKITDPICVKNNVGFQMSNKTKYKILAQATHENIDSYMALLWKKGTVPNKIKKFYMRKKILLNSNKQLLQLNRDCEKMFKSGEDPKKIATYYLIEKQKIETRYEKIKNRLKTINKYKAKEAQKNK